ncbi:MAG: type II toxin-antitoxin system PemK/MazF family toxin [Brevibacterium sp.]
MSWKSLVNRAVRIGVREGVRYLKDAKAKNASGPSRDTPRDGGSGPRPGSGSPAGSGSRRQSPAPQQSGSEAGAYPGDYRGAISVSYSPDLDGDADPGEVVWGWIPYEEDHSQGKDRPSLVVGRDGRWVLVLMLTSKDHIPGGFGEVREDRNAKWMNIGSGDWDSQGRPSEIRLDRVIRVDPNSIRREGAIMPREVFEKVAANIES